MKPSVVAYVYAIVATAVASLVGLYWASPSVNLSLLFGSSILALLGVVGAQTRYRVQGSTFGEVSFIPYLSALVVYPNWASVGLIGVGACLAEIGKKKPAIKRAFNIAQFTLSAAVATLLYVSLGGKSLQLDDHFELVPHVAAVFGFLVVNTLSVAAAIGFAEGKSVIKTWVEGNSAGLIYDIVAVPVVYAFGRVFADWGGWGVLALGVLVVGFRVTYQTKHQLEITNKELLQLFVQTVEFRDPYTSGHSQRVSRYSRIIARAIGLMGKDLERVTTAALLHDVGKIHEIFAPILSKPGRLTNEERAIMELHPIKSAELVAKISELQDIVPAVRHHHENWDGTGYPDQLSGRDIPLASRIIMFADTIDAMTTDRPYRKAMTESEVRAELRKYRGTQFDPQICDMLLDSPLYLQIFTGDDSRPTLSLTQILERAKRPRTPAVA